MVDPVAVWRVTPMKEQRAFGLQGGLVLIHHRSHAPDCYRINHLLYSVQGISPRFGGHVRYSSPCNNLSSPINLMRAAKRSFISRVPSPMPANATMKTITIALARRA